MPLSRQYGSQKLNIKIALFIIKHLKVINLLFSLFLFIFIMVFIAYPFYQKYTFLKDQEIPKLKQVQKEEIAKLEILKQEYEKKQNKLFQLQNDELQKLVFKSSDKTVLYLPIQKLVKDSGFLLETLSIVDNGASQFGQKQSGVKLDNESTLNIGEFTIQLSLIGGNYDSLKYLLALFEKSTPLLDVVSITFNPEAYNDNADAVSYNIVLKAYYLANKEKQNNNTQK